MSRYIIRRLLYMLFVVWGVSLVAFIIVQLTPGCPAIHILGPQATPEAIAHMREQMGLNRHVIIQYFSWLFRAVQGDFGVALRDGVPVLPTLLGRLPTTILLTVSSIGMAVVIGVSIGVLAAIKPNSFIDWLARSISLLGISMPSFWFGVLLILIFAYIFRLFPVSGWGTPKHIVLPALALGLNACALIMRLVRSTMLDVLNEDYIRTARAKGLHEYSIIVSHALRNCMIPVVTIVGLQAGYLLGGAVVIETVFSIPGTGLYAYQRLMQRDYPMIMGSLVLFALLFSVVNLLTDLLYAYLDPRIRYD